MWEGMRESRQEGWRRQRIWYIGLIKILPFLFALILYVRLIKQHTCQSSHTNPCVCVGACVRVYMRAQLYIEWCAYVRSLFFLLYVELWCLSVQSHFYLQILTLIFVVPSSRLLLFSLPPRVWVMLQDLPGFQRCIHPPIQPCPVLESQEDPVCQVIHNEQR